MTKIQSSRNGALDALRVIAAVFIVLHHFQQYTGAYFPSEPNFYGGWFGFGNMVELFFLLSGYLVYKYIEIIKNDSTLTLWKWYLKRAARLLPLLIASVFVFQLGKIIYLNMDHIYRTQLLEYPISLWETLITCLAMHDGWAITTAYINASTWYISVLLICYLVFYIITKAAHKLGCSPTYMYFGMILLGMSPLCHRNLPLLTPATSRGYYAFFFGVLLACFVNRFGMGKRLKITAFAVYAVITVLLLKASQIVILNQVFVLTFMLFPSVIILCETDFAKNIFRHRIWNTLGAMTYGMYIWHVPVLLWIFIVLDAVGYAPNMANRVIMVMFVALMFAVGAVSYYFVEKPLNKIVQQKLAKLLEKI